MNLESVKFMQFCPPYELLNMIAPPLSISEYAIFKSLAPLYANVAFLNIAFAAVAFTYNAPPSHSFPFV